MQKEAISVKIDKKELTKHFYLVSLWLKIQIVIQRTDMERSGRMRARSKGRASALRHQILNNLALTPLSVTSSTPPVQRIAAAAALG